MPIKVICGKCGAQSTTRDEFAGRRGACPKCKAVLVIPAIDSPDLDIRRLEEVVRLASPHASRLPYGAVHRALERADRRAGEHS